MVIFLVLMFIFLPFTSASLDVIRFFKSAGILSVRQPLESAGKSAG